MLTDVSVKENWLCVLDDLYGTAHKGHMFDPDDTPFVHITLPQPPHLISRGALEGIVRDHQFEKDPAAPKVPSVLCYTDDGQPEWITPRIHYAVEDYKYPLVILSVHHDAAQIPEIGHIAEECFKKMVHSFDWLNG
jgi:hypothetical protein